MRKYNHTIDVLKGIAILLVIYTHYGWTANQRRGFSFLFIVNMAIPVFMIITGYVYSLSMLRKAIAHAEEAYQLPIILKRITRYTIPLIAVILWEIADPHFDILAMSRSELLVWAIDGTAGKGSYYYPVMMQLIFFFPVIYFIIDIQKSSGLISCLAMNAVYELLAWAYGMNTDCYRLLAFRYTFVIAAGVFAYKNHKISKTCSAIMTLFGAVFIVIVGRMNYVPSILNKDWLTTNFIASMFIIPAMIWILQNVRIQFAPLETLGRASYHIFLVQMVYYAGYYDLLKDRIRSWPVHLATGMAICLAAGVAFYYVDKPVQDWISRKC